MFLSRNRKNDVYPCKLQFCDIKVGFKGVKNYIGMFSLCLPVSMTSGSKSGPEIIKLFFMLNSAEHENFSANKYENANFYWHFHIY